jgi:hypothetical protein
MGRESPSKKQAFGNPQIESQMPMKHTSALAAMMLLLSGAGIATGDIRVNLLPKLQPGQKLTYLVSYHTERDTKTESRVVLPMAPEAARSALQGLLRAEVLDGNTSASHNPVRIRTTFETMDSRTGAVPNQLSPHTESAEPQQAKRQTVEFVILTDGRLDQLQGLDALSPEEQHAWQEWVARFVAAWTFPSAGVRLGQKWKSEQAEPAPSLIAGLSWLQEATYVRQEPCRAMQMTAQGVLSAPQGQVETCAVLLTTAALKQKSPPKDATPEDFKLHELKTMGTAKGRNEIIAYISLTTGLVVRAIEEANQQMDVVVAKADGSNRVHYNVDAKSHSEVLLVTETPLNRP